MTLPTIRATLILFLLIAGAAPDASAQANDVAERMLRVEQGLRSPTTIRGDVASNSIEARMQALNIPGVSVAVISDGRIEWAKGYGVTVAGGTQPVDTATLFQAASISKPVAAMAALRMVEAGQLDLDEDVNVKLASWKVERNGFSQQAPVTLRRLLSHNAGLTVHGFRGYAQGEAVPTTVQVLNGAAPANSATVRPDVRPGSIWRYSGGGSTVAQLLMQDVSGRAFPDLVRELVLQPAGMVHSGFEQPLPAARAGAAATGHLATGTPVRGSWHTYPEMFAAGLWTTPSDLARLALEVQQSADGASSRILSPAMTREMLRLQAGEYGLGFGVGRGDGWTSFSHGGANQGFRALFFALTDGRGAVVMTNSDNGSIIAGEIVRAIAHEYGWPTFRSVERDVVRLPDAVLASVAGEYEFRRGETTFTLRLVVDGERLRSYGPPLGERSLLPGGGDAFFMLENTSILRFERGNGGAVVAAILEQGGEVVRLPRTR